MCGWIRHSEWNVKISNQLGMGKTILKVFGIYSYFQNLGLRYLQYTKTIESSNVKEVKLTTFLLIFTAG